MASTLQQYQPFRRRTPHRYEAKTNRYQNGASYEVDKVRRRVSSRSGRAIPDTGPITATIIKTEWSHPAGSRWACSADGAAWINKTPSTLIKYSDFRGQSAGPEGEMGPLSNICPGGNLSFLNHKQINILNTGDPLTYGIPCDGTYHRGDLIPDGGFVTLDCQGLPWGTEQANSSYLYWEQGGFATSFFTGHDVDPNKGPHMCGAMGVATLAPGSWRLTGSYEIGVHETTQFPSGGEAVHHIMYVWGGQAHKPSGRINESPELGRSSKFSASITNAIQQWAYVDGTFTVNFTVTETNPHIIVGGGWAVNTYGCGAGMCPTNTSIGLVLTRLG